MLGNLSKKELLILSEMSENWEGADFVRSHVELSTVTRMIHPKEILLIISQLVTDELVTRKIKKPKKQTIFQPESHLYNVVIPSNHHRHDQ